MITFSPSIAIAMVLLVTFLWGTWVLVVKHLGTYPLAAFMLWLYIFCVAISAAAVFFLEPVLKFENIFDSIGDSPQTALVVMLSGVVYAFGIQTLMMIMKDIGLIIATAIGSTCSILAGTLLSAAFGGIPQNVSIATILMAAIILVFSAIVCQYSRFMREKDLRVNWKTEKSKSAGKTVLLLIFTCMLLLPAYPFGVSVGTRSTSNPNGFNSFCCIAILMFGTLVGTFIYSGILLTVRKQWHYFYNPDKKYVFLAIAAAFGHAGGNILHTLAVPSVSMAIAWPMGNTYILWHYFWGLLYGEYKGVKPKTYLVLLAGVLLAVMGIVLLSISIYH
jgi:hypothetical protein